MGRLGFDLCENCDRLWNEGGGHDVKTCPGCDLTTAIQERHKAEVKADRYKAALSEVHRAGEARVSRSYLSKVLECHKIDPDELKAD